MTDPIDHAQSLEMIQRKAALAAHRARVAASFEPPDDTLNKLCIDCDEPIEPERLRALRGATSRCLACAERFETRVRRPA